MAIERSGRKINSRPIKILLMIAGLIFLATGSIGIFVPLLPTTPFLILAAGCFIRSSERLYNWTLTNRIFGKYLKGYLEKKGIPLGVKLFTLFLLWFTILSSAIFFIDLLWVRIILIIIAVSVTVHLIMIKTYRDPADEK